jgi:hypothetical protein
MARRSNRSSTQQEQLPSMDSNLEILKYKLNVINDYMPWQWFAFFKDAEVWDTFCKEKRSVKLYNLLGLSAKQLVNLLKNLNIIDIR